MTLRLPVLVFAAAVAVCFAAPAGAGAYGRYVSFGDSSSTGSGLGAQKSGSVALCYQTDKGYPTLVANALGISDFVPRNCSAAWINDLTTPQKDQFGNDFVPPQFDWLTAGTAIGSLSMGDNDENGFANVQTCFQDSPGNIAATPCKDAFVHGGVNQLVDNTKTMAYDLGLAIDRFYELAPNATLFIVGYPRLTPPDGANCWGKTNISPGDAPVVDAWQQAVAYQQQTVAAQHGAVYVDMYEYSAGHDGCQPNAADRWSNPDILTGPTGWNNHPTEAGEAAMAARMVSMIDTPRPPRPRSPEAAKQSLTVKLATSRVRAVKSDLAPFTRVRPAARGAKLKVTLSKAGQVNFALDRVKSGRIKNGKCRSMSRRAGRGRKACSIYVRATGTVGLSLGAGTSIVYVTGRSASKRLAAGRYRVRATTGGLIAKSGRFTLKR